MQGRLGRLQLKRGHRIARGEDVLLFDGLGGAGGLKRVRQLCRDGVLFALIALEVDEQHPRPDQKDAEQQRQADVDQIAGKRGLIRSVAHNIGLMNRGRGARTRRPER